jgi:hypothetical protein
MWLSFARGRNAYWNGGLPPPDSKTDTSLWPCYGGVFLLGHRPDCLNGKFFGVFKGEAFLASVKNAVRISDADVEAWHSARTRTGR